MKKAQKGKETAEMYDFLKFIDSPDIREYNRKTKFTPAEQAVLVSKSKRTTMEEKLDALKYLVGHYQEQEFGDESVSSCDMFQEEKMPLREVVLRTIRVWEETLRDRTSNAGMAYAAQLVEIGYPRDEWMYYRYFSSYEKAYDYICREKRHYLQDSDLKDVGTYCVIHRFKLDNSYNDPTDSDVYIFDNDMRLTEIYPYTLRLYEDDEYQVLVDDYEAFVPLPFKAGDILKADTRRDGLLYGVMPYGWEKPDNPYRRRMMCELETWDNGCKRFDYIEDIDILGLSYCTEEELPENEQKLKLIRDVRQGKIDFYRLLYFLGKG